MIGELIGRKKELLRFLNSKKKNHSFYKAMMTSFRQKWSLKIYFPLKLNTYKEVIKGKAICPSCLFLFSNNFIFLNNSAMPP